MYELCQVGTRTWYINCPAKIGLWQQTDTDVWLIDSGNDKEAGRRVRKLLDERGWKLRGIVNTHSNADHIGGNRYLQQQTGCRIFANGIEAAFTRRPILEPAFLYGGYPCKDLRHKFLLAAESDAEDVSSPDFPRELEIIPLPGHFFDMIGVRTPDGVAFVADCLSSEATLEKYQISFIYDVTAYLDTLDRVQALDAKMFVPAHAEAATDLTALIDCNRRKVHEVAEHLVLLAAAIPFFLPHMHDRYFFATDILTLALAVVDLRLAPLPLLCEFASLLGYHAYLKLRYLLPMSYGAGALIVVLTILAAALLAALFSPDKKLRGSA